MTDQDLDQAYSALCAALGRAGEAQAQLFLAALSLSLMARFADAGEVLPLIENALRQTAGGAATPVEPAAESPP